MGGRASWARRDRLRSGGRVAREGGAHRVARSRRSGSPARTSTRAKDAGGRLRRGERGLPFFEDGDEPAQYDGYGAIASEILDQCPRSRPPPSIVPVGNGALIGGDRTACSASAAPGTLVVGAVAKNAPVMEIPSWRAGRVVSCDRLATFADGLAVRVAIPRAVERLSRVRRPHGARLRARDRAGDGAFRGRRRSASRRARCLGARGAAGADGASGPIVLVVTGRNIDEEVFRRACERPESFAA